MHDRHRSRRSVLKLGAAVLALGTLGLTDRIVAAQGAQPAPAQIPRPAAPSTPRQTPSAASLTRGTWLWQRSEYANDTTIAAPNPSQYTLTLAPDGSLATRADCNRGTGRYTTSGAQLTLQLGPTTLIACPPGSRADVFLRDLQNVATYVFDGENLVLNLKVDTGNMIFSPQPPTALTGAPWRVTGVNNGRGGVASVVQGATLSATFGDDGTVTGRTGCNTFRGSYTHDPTTIAFGPLASTRRACLSEQATAQEQAFLAALAASARYELAGDRLTLRDAGGATQVVLTRQ